MMEVYHWLILVLMVFLVIFLFTRISGALIRTAISVVAIVLFAGFVWGTMSPEAKSKVTDFCDDRKQDVANFFEDIFHFGEELPEKQEEAMKELYQ